MGGLESIVGSNDLLEYVGVSAAVVAANAREAPKTSPKAGK